MSLLKTRQKDSLEKLEIREKLAPFSHLSGISCLVPLSDWVITAYPALLKVGALEFPIALTGPVKEFTVQMDLERNCVWIWGTAKEGQFRFKLSATEAGLFLLVDKAFKNGITVGKELLHRKGTLLLAAGGHTCAISPSQVERLSLGNWKAQDWDLVGRRRNFAEIAPILFMLGQKLPSTTSASIESPEHFFLAALSGLCAPTLQDAIYAGLPPFTGTPIAFLRATYETIRAYLIRDFAILPNLPSAWDAGRVLGLQTAYGTIDVEWTKKQIRRMIFIPSHSFDVAFQFPKEITSYRCNGQRLTKGATFSVEANKRYLFDRFQK